MSLTRSAINRLTVLTSLPKAPPPLLGIAVVPVAKGKNSPALIWDRYQVDRDQCNVLISSYVSDNSTTYPMQIGEDYTEEVKDHMALFLVDTYLKNYRATHCASLPVSLFRIPWAPASNDSSFVKL